jgi:hypothetical protein
MNDKELAAVKQAVEALKRMKRYGDSFAYRSSEQNPYEQVCEAITDCEQVIVQDALDKMAENARELGLTYDDAPAPVQSAERGEPVAWMDVDENGAMSSLRYWSEPDNRHEVALYTTPPIVATPLAAQKKRPPNCGTGYCSCIECVVEPVAHCEAGPDYCPQCLKEAAQPAAWVGLTDEDKHEIERKEKNT